MRSYVRHVDGGGGATGVVHPFATQVAVGLQQNVCPGQLKSPGLIIRGIYEIIRETCRWRRWLYHWCCASIYHTGCCRFTTKCLSRTEMVTRTVNDRLADYAMTRGDIRDAG
jgi:hypothetical protein